MTTTARKITSSSLFVLLTFALGGGVRAQPPVTLPPEPPSVTVGEVQLPSKAIQYKALLLLKTIEANRYEEFAAAITDDFKAAMPPKAFQAMREPLSSRLEKGYDLSYMGEVRKGEYTTYVWKIVFRDRGIDGKSINEMMTTFTIRNVPEGEQNTEKLAGIFLD